MNSQVGSVPVDKTEQPEYESSAPPPRDASPSSQGPGEQSREPSYSRTKSVSTTDADAALDSSSHSVAQLPAVMLTAGLGKPRRERAKRPPTCGSRERSLPPLPLSDMTLGNADTLPKLDSMAHPKKKVKKNTPPTRLTTLDPTKTPERPVRSRKRQLSPETEPDPAADGSQDQPPKSRTRLDPEEMRSELRTNMPIDPRSPSMVPSTSTAPEDPANVPLPPPSPSPPAPMHTCTAPPLQHNVIVSNPNPRKRKARPSDADREENRWNETHAWQQQLAVEETPITVTFFLNWKDHAKRVTRSIRSMKELYDLVRARFIDVPRIQIAAGLTLHIKEETYGVMMCLESLKDIYAGAVIEIRVQRKPSLSPRTTRDESGSDGERPHSPKRKEKRRRRREATPVSGYKAKSRKRRRKKGPRYVCRLRGLPFTCTTEDLTEFFAGLKIVDEGIHLLRGASDKPTGTAVVEFEDEDSLSGAMQKDREHVGDRYVEIFESTGEEYDRLSNQVEVTGEEHVVWMRGLPYNAKRQDIVDFFSPLQPDAIYIVNDSMGRSSGECFAIFETADEVTRACSAEYHKKHMGTRYVEIYTATPRQLAQKLAIPFEGGGQQGGPCPYALQMHGLPARGKFGIDAEVARLFEAYGVTPLRILRPAAGQPASFAEFRTMDEVERALSLDKFHVGGGAYLEVWKIPRRHMLDKVAQWSQGGRGSAMDVPPFYSAQPMFSYAQTPFSVRAPTQILPGARSPFAAPTAAPIGTTPDWGPPTVAYNHPSSAGPSAYQFNWNQPMPFAWAPAQTATPPFGYRQPAEHGNDSFAPGDLGRAKRKGGNRANETEGRGSKMQGW